jgi:hypothetical protein
MIQDRRAVTTSAAHLKHDDRADFTFAGVHDPIGLCASCRHARIVHSARGSHFYLCRLAETDPRFAKYPRLPVLRCAGYEFVDDAEDPA